MVLPGVNQCEELRLRYIEIYEFVTLAAPQQKEAHALTQEIVRIVRFLPQNYFATDPIAIIHGTSNLNRTNHRRLRFLPQTCEIFFIQRPFDFRPSFPFPQHSWSPREDPVLQQARALEHQDRRPLNHQIGRAALVTAIPDLTLYFSLTLNRCTFPMDIGRPLRGQQQLPRLLLATQSGGQCLHPHWASPTCPYIKSLSLLL